MVDPDTRERLKALYQSLEDRVLEPDDPVYVALFEDPKLSSIDPVEHMATGIEFAAIESVQLFSGHRGTGKSTQLRRLKRRLESGPAYKVVICDMEDYLPMADEVDVVDFLLAAAGALSDALAIEDLLGTDPVNSYWVRFTSWLQSQQIEISELGLTGKADSGPVSVGAGVKIKLKNDPEFRKRIRERMKLHVGTFSGEVHTFVQDCLRKLRERHGDDTQLVVIYDNIEHLRGTTSNAPQVAASVERLFRAHADSLRFPFVHTVFTVPPWLRVQFTGAGNDRFDSYCRVPCVKVRESPTGEVGVAARRNTDGLEALWRVASKRGDMQWLLGERAAFDELAWSSGGHLRDLFRMLSFLAIDAARNGVPVTPERLRLAIEEQRSAYLGFTNQEAAWLKIIDETGTLDVDEASVYHELARFLDTHVVLGYRKGKDWYGIHPLIRDDVARRAAAWHATHATSREG